MSSPVFDTAVFDDALFGGTGELFDDGVFDATVFDTGSVVVAVVNALVYWLRRRRR